MLKSINSTGKPSLPSIVKTLVIAEQVQRKEQEGFVEATKAVATRRLVFCVAAAGKHPRTLLFINDRQSPAVFRVLVITMVVAPVLTLVVLTEH